MIEVETKRLILVSLNFVANWLMDEIEAECFQNPKKRISVKKRTLDYKLWFI